MNKISSNHLVGSHVSESIVDDLQQRQQQREIGMLRSAPALSLSLSHCRPRLFPIGARTVSKELGPLRVPCRMSTQAQQQGPLIRAKSPDDASSTPADPQNVDDRWARRPTGDEKGMVCGTWGDGMDRGSAQKSVHETASSRTRGLVF